MAQRLIRMVAFNPDSLDVQYVGETDVRAEGAIYQTHTISIARDAQLDDEIRELEEAADHLLGEAIGQWARTLPVDLAADVRSRMDLDDTDDDDQEES